MPPSPKHNQQIVLGIVAGILIYLALMLNGQAVAQGVVEEKSSRVVELLLATVRPWQLMAGKVVGIGIVGLIQVAVIGVAGVVAGFATGSLSIQASAAAGTIIWLVVWFLLGFVAYALAFAAVAALVSRQEDVAVGRHTGADVPDHRVRARGVHPPGRAGQPADQGHVADPDCSRRRSCRCGSRWAAYRHGR